jgi:hypothetical protein
MLKVAEGPGIQAAQKDAHKDLVERVAASRYIARSVRLRDLLLYLCQRVLEESAAEIHEQEVGCKVFGRAVDYDTTIDNIVRVHASQLRKRLEQYFSAEGADEPWIIEIPKGNYAPVFRERAVQDSALTVTAPESLEPPAEPPFTPRTDWRLWTLAALVALLASSTVYLFLQNRASRQTAGPVLDKPAVRLFWSQVFRAGQPTDIVLDDATVGLYQELVGRQVGLTEYFDRSYLRNLEEMASKGRLDAKQASAIVTRRQSTYSSSHLLWRLFQAAGPLQNQSTVYFARDYTFRGIKSNNAILLGNSRSNPWMEPFESRLGLRWTFQDDLSIYYPVDTLASPSEQNRFRVPADPAEAREGYCMIALLPNLTGTGKVLVIAGTGGSTVSAAGDFLADDQAVAHLRAMLPVKAGASAEFPYFESLIRMKSRSSLPKDVTVVLCRPLRD